jgi:hypothetical protein
MYAVDAVRTLVIAFEQCVSSNACLFTLVMRDTDGRYIELVVQMPEFNLHSLAQLLVERRKRLVHEDNLRIEHDRPGERDTLALAARQLMRLPLQLGESNAHDRPDGGRSITAHYTNHFQRF